MAVDLVKRKEGPTVFHLFCFLAGIFLGSSEQVKLGFQVSLVHCFTSECRSCFGFVLVLDLVQEASCYLTMSSLEGVLCMGTRVSSKYICKKLHIQKKKPKSKEPGRGKKGKLSVLPKGDILITKGQSSPRDPPMGKSHRAGQYKPAVWRAWGLANNACCPPPTLLELNFKFCIETIPVEFLQFHSTTLGA